MYISARAAAAAAPAIENDTVNSGAYAKHTYNNMLFHCLWSGAWLLLSENGRGARLIICTIMCLPIYCNILGVILFLADLSVPSGEQI